MIGSLRGTLVDRTVGGEVLVEEGARRFDFVGSAKPTDNFKSLAQRIRQRLDLDADWAESLASWEDAMQALRKAIERTGIIVFSNGVVGLNNHRPLDSEEFRGFVLCDDSEARVDLVVLERLTSGAALGEVADVLRDRFPDRFPDRAVALTRAADVAERYVR